MNRTLLCLCLFFLVALNCHAQLRMTRVEAKEAMRTLAFTEEVKTIQEGGFETIYYRNTKLDYQNILRINPEGYCDQLTIVMPMKNWDEMVRGFNGEGPNPTTRMRTGPNNWISPDGITTQMVPHPDKRHFSLISTLPGGKK